MILIKEDEIVESDEVDEIIGDLSSELISLDPNFYVVAIKDNVWRLYYGEKSILTIDVTVNSSSGNEIVTITDYNSNTKVFNLDDQDDIQQYVVTTASKIL